MNKHQADVLRSQIDRIREHLYSVDHIDVRRVRDIEPAIENVLLEMESFVRTFEHNGAVWRMRDGQLIPIRDMRDDHLQATERAIEAGTAPASEEDSANITAERERRGLKKLRPYKGGLRSKIAHALTELISFYRPASAEDRQHTLRGFAKFLRETVAPAMNNEDGAEVLGCADVLDIVNPGDGRFDLAYRVDGVIPDKTLKALCPDVPVDATPSATTKWEKDPPPGPLPPYDGPGDT